MVLSSKFSDSYRWCGDTYVFLDTYSRIEKKSFLRFRAADAAFVYFVESVPVYIQVLPFLAFRAIECFACLPNAFLLYARKGLDEACKRLRYKFLIQVLSFDEQRLYFF